MLSKILYDDSFYTTTKQEDIFKHNPYLHRAASKKVAQERDHKIKLNQCIDMTKEISLRTKGKSIGINQNQAQNKL
jgi:hypothetical protein